ncbi:aldolase/citrate lyase family protein [Mycobacterium sp. 050134]|uniref:aldolase/citrate lyase family protein n=1 Tax=Mycobacterium sp. 050134 TaxID=3096111 RepID=UPI002ED9DFFA
MDGAMEADSCRCQINRVNPADLEANSVLLPPDAGVFTREVGAVAKAYFGAIDAGNSDSMLAQFDPNGFHIHVLSPDATLTSEDDCRECCRRIVSTFSRLRHTVVVLDPKLVTANSAQARLIVNSEFDRRNPATDEDDRATVTVDVGWDLTRTADGRWVISGQREAFDPAPEFSTERTREFAVNYLNNLDRRNLDGMLAVLAPERELNIALEGGQIIEDFPQWFKTIDETFINSVHRIQGLVALENADGTIDAHLKICFTADQRNPEPSQDRSVDFSVERIWTLRRDGRGRPQLVNQRPFALFDLRARVDPLDVNGAHEAARHGENEVVRDWLRHGGDPNAYAADGFNLFLVAAATANIEVLRMLLLEGVGATKVDPVLALKDPERPNYRSNILAPHLSAQRGDVTSTLLLLSKHPEQLHARVEVNGHTPLLQAAFYGHVELAKSILDNLGSILPQGANIEAEKLRLFSETTVRGINATELGRQFQNHAMIEVLEPFDKATTEAKQADTKALLEAIPASPRNPEAGTEAQQASESVFKVITSGLAKVALLKGSDLSTAVTNVITELKEVIQDPNFDPNRLAGDLLQTPIIAAVTGTNANEGVAQLRRGIVDILLERGADPHKAEMHPMAVDAIIRAAVFNHFEDLKRFEVVMTPEAMKQALNHKPAVNGLTALHDSVLRAATGSASYLQQIRWARGLGAAADIPDHTGRTQRDYAAAAFVTDGQKENAAAVWEALQLNSPPPRPYEFFSYENLTFLTIPAHVADKGTVWRTLAGSSNVIVKGIDLDGPNALSAEVAQNHSFGTATMNRCWPDGRPADAKEVQAFAAQTRGTPLLPIMRFEKPDSYIKELLGAGLFGALLVNPESPEAVRALLRDVYFPQRPDAQAATRPSTAQHPLGKRAVGADNIAQRTFAEYPKMMDILNDMFVGGLSFSKPATPDVLRQLPALKEIGVKMVEIDHAGIRTEFARSCAPQELDLKTEAAISAIEKAARDAGVVLSGRFSTDEQILRAFEMGYRHITTITQRGAHEMSWRTWMPAGKTDGGEPLPREMPIRRPCREFNDVRRALTDGELVVFGALTTPDLNNAAQLANSGILNAIAIEREHGTWTTDEAVRHIIALREHTNVLVRLGSALDPEVGTFIGSGVAGLIATAVLDADEARHFLRAVDQANVETYGENDKRKWAVPVVMMETEGAANDTDKIVPMLQEHEGVCHIGPLDLSASLGAAWGTERYESTLRKIDSTARAAGVPLANVLNTLEEALDQGLGMVLAPVGMDGGALDTGITGTNPLESLQKDNSAR